MSDIRLCDGCGARIGHDEHSLACPCRHTEPARATIDAKVRAVEIQDVALQIGDAAIKAGELGLVDIPARLMELQKFTREEANRLLEPERDELAEVAELLAQARWPEANVKEMAERENSGTWSRIVSQARAAQAYTRRFAAKKLRATPCICGLHVGPCPRCKRLDELKANAT